LAACLGLSWLVENPVPNFDSGFGRVNMANSIRIVHSEPEPSFHEDKIIGKSTTWKKKISVQRKGTILKVTLVWSDPPGAQIVNHLAIWIEKSKRLLSTNNVQQIVSKITSPGDVELKVACVGELNESPQPFAVVWRLYKDAEHS
jgi:serine protease AprX